jgi:hypothetical protein
VGEGSSVHKKYNTGDELLAYSAALSVLATNDRLMDAISLRVLG